MGAAESQKAEIFQRVRVITNDGIFDHPYAQHQINMGPDGALLLVQETRDDRTLTIYSLAHVKRTQFTPTKLEMVQT